MKNLRNLAVAACLAVTDFTTSAANQQWNVNPNQNWSVGANWNVFPGTANGAAPTSADVLYFENTLYNTGLSNSAKVVNNIVDANTSAGALNYTALATPFSSTMAFYTTLVPSGVTLTLGGLGSTPALAVGDVPGSGSWLSSGTTTNFSTITGAGALSISDTASKVSVGWRNRATLDLTGLNTVTVSVSNVWVGASAENPNTTGPTGWLLLGATNNITTSANLAAPGILMGYATNASGLGLIGLGAVNNFNTDGLVVGGRKANTSTLTFSQAYSNTTPLSAFTLRGSAGGTTPISVFSIGDLRGDVNGYSATFPGTSSGGTGMADFTGGTVDILADTIYVGRNHNGNFTQSGTGTGTLIVEHGTVNATNLHVALKAGTNATSATGTLVVKGDATLTVTNLTLGFRTNAGSATSSLFISNSAVVNVASDMYVGNASPTIVVGGTGQLNIGGAVTRTSSNAAPNLSLFGGTLRVGSGNMYLSSLVGHGTITNVSTVSLTNTTATTMTLGVNGTTAQGSPIIPGTLNIKSGNLALSNSVTTRFKLGSSLTPGGTTSDYLVVDGNLTSAVSKIDIGFLGVPVNGYYDLINAGSLTGTFTNVFVNATRGFSNSLDYSLANHVRLFVTNTAPPASLLWSGGTGLFGAWNLTNTLAFNGNTEKFYNLDSVIFDDSSSQQVIALTGTLVQSGMTFSNNTKNYILFDNGSSANKLSGPGGLTKNGTGTVVIYMTGGGSDYLGPVNVNEGTLQIQSSGGNGAFFGSTNKTITVANGATFDIYGNTVGSGSAGSAIGWPFTISGNGYGGIGAIAHTKLSSGPSLYTPSLTLAADSSMGVTSNGLTLFINGSSFASSLNLGGYTLSTTGNGNVSFDTLIATNSGSIQVNNPMLVLKDVLLDGAGSVNVGSKILALGRPGSTGWILAGNSVNKAINIGGGQIWASANGGVTIPVNSAVSLSGALSVSNNQAIRMAGVISGGYGLTKSGTASLVLAGANTYSGSTVVSAGTLTMDATGSVGSSPLVHINSGASLDVTAQSGGYSVPFGQTVLVDGSAVGSIVVPVGGTLGGVGVCSGSVAVNGGTITPGKLDLPRTITVNSLSLSNAALTFELDSATTAGSSVNDLVAATTLAVDPGSFSTISIVPIGPLNTSGGQYTLFTYGGATLPSSVTNNLVLSSSTRYSFAFVDPATTPGSIQIVVTGAGLDLTWLGGDPLGLTTWNINSRTNWLSGVDATNFLNGDNVLFDDTANTNIVALSNPQLRPSSIVLSNNTVPYTFSGNGGIRAGVLTALGSAGLTIANNRSNVMAGTGLVLSNGVITFNQTPNSALNAVLNSSGAGQIVKEGTNTLNLIGNSGATFSSPMQVNNGTLMVGSSNSFGSGIVTVTNSASVDLNGQVLSLPTLAVSGAGVDGLGVINNGGAWNGAFGTNVYANNFNAISKLTLHDDATFGALNRWDMGGPSSVFTGNGHKLTKIGASDVYLGPGSDTGLGDVDIKEGKLVFAYAGTDLGDTSKSIIVRSNASLAFAFDIAAGPKPVTVEAGADIRAFVNNGIVPSVGTSNSYTGDLTFLGAGVLRIANLAGLNLAGNVHGPAGLTNADRGTLTLSGSNDFSGDLTVNLGQLTIASDTALPTNTAVNMLCTGLPSSDNVFLQLLNVTTPATVPANLVGIRSPSGAITPTLSGNGTWQGPVNMIGQQLEPSQFPQINFSGATNLVITGPIVQSGTPNLSLNIGGFPGTVRFAGPLQFSGTLRMGSQGLGIDPVLITNFTTMQLDSSNNNFTNMLFWRGKIIVGADNAIPTKCPITYSFIVTDNDHRAIMDFHGHTQSFSNYPGLAPSGGFPAQPTWFGNDSTNADATIVFNSAITNTWACWILDNLDTNLTVVRQTGLTVSNGYLRLPFWSWPAGSFYSPQAIVAGITNNTYTGPTRVVGGTLQVDTMITNTPVTVSGSGTLTGIGPIYAPVTVNSGGTLSPGGTNTLLSAVGGMTNFGSMTLNSGGIGRFEVNLTAKTNDFVFGLTNLVLNGCTLTITNTGAQAYTNGYSARLFFSSSYSVGSVVMNPVRPAYGLRWDTTQLGVNGTLGVIAVNTNTTTLNSSVSGNNLTLSWPSDRTGWRLQTQTNDIMTGLSPLWFDVPGSTTTNQITVTIDPLNPTVFYRLTYP